MTQNRFKSWALWLSMGAMVVWVVKTVSKGTIDISAEMDMFLNLLCPILTGFGIINVPTDAKHI